MSTPPQDPLDREPDLDETVVRDEWGEETVVRRDETVVGRVQETVVEEREVVPVRRPPLIWPYLLAFLLLVLGGLGAYYYFSQEDESPVPAVVGQPEEDAEATVREAGFEPRSEQQESPRPRGVVLDQSPDAGTELEEGKTVLLTVSSGPPRETVPDVVGEQADAAVDAIEAASFKAAVTEVFSDEDDETVIRQEPAAGGNLKEGSTVALVVSKGQRPVDVPDVVGTTSSEATATLRDAGLEANVVSVPSAESAGTVLAQNPAAGTTVEVGSRVRLNIAQAPDETTPTTTSAPPPVSTQTTTQATTTEPPPTPAPATVPDVVGQELAVGARGFGDAGLKVAVRYVPSREPQGRIVAQAQPAGMELRRGDTVQVNVSTGADPAAATAVPSVTGEDVDEARAQLEDAGFEVLAVELASASAVGEVISQSPGGGASVASGSLVILYVGS
ncbi:MAG: PASTA domain-containing protein [Gaiellaceae bacterium MAG52_C11]|nr:PASTA domain-containing protein [Candidatus Gaiellasilicea maunaloa]